MEEGEAVTRLREKKMLISPDALVHLLEHENAEQVLERIMEKPAGLVVTMRRVEEVAEDFAASQKTVQVEVHQQEKFRPPAREIESRLKTTEKTDITGKSRCTGSVDDFVQYFRSRFEKTSKLLRGRITDSQIVTASKVGSETGKKTLRVLGMVVNKRSTKNGHILIEIEDTEGTLACLVPRDAPAQLKQAAGEVLHDEVLAFDGYASGGSLFIVKEITWPDLPYREKKLVEDDANIAFISDVHVGSKYFLQEQFASFLKFLNGESEKQEHVQIAGKIKYLFVAGDNVDGIGVYPSQERELVTKDIYTQYEIFAEFMKNVPEYIEVVIGPGNHDAVRTAQPSPRIPAECTFELEQYRNVHFVGSPAYFEAHGLRTLMYHGDSFHAIASSMQKLSGCFTNPEKAAIEMLKRRNLSPTYGENPIIPEHDDYLFIEEAPDLFHFGHVHHNGYANYRGTTIINSGTWQDTTEYQIKQGHVPTPCQLPVYNMRSGSLSVVSFK